MELNQLPENYDGPQKRQTEFDSEEAKLAFDAKNVVAKSKDSLKVSGVEAPSRDLILMVAQIMVGLHRKDYNEALIGAINANLDAEEESERFRSAESREKSRAKYEAFIDGLKLSQSDTVKLKEMMSEDGYVNAVKTAQEMKAERIYTFEEIVEKLMTYTPEIFREICEVMENPELLIVSDKSFDETVTNMDENKHYTSASGKAQENAYVYRSSDSPYNNLTRPVKGGVSIVDGIPHPEQLTGVSKKLGARRDHLTEKFAAKNMSHIGVTEMATLQQKSLIKAQVANDNSLIVDNWEDGNGTITFVNPDDLTDSSLVACSRFYSYFRRAYFGANDPSNESVRARGRAAMQVL